MSPVILSPELEEALAALGGDVSAPVFRPAGVLPARPPQPTLAGQIRESFGDRAPALSTHEAAQRLLDDAAKPPVRVRPARKPVSAESLAGCDQTTFLFRGMNPRGRNRLEQQSIDEEFARRREQWADFERQAAGMETVAGAREKRQGAAERRVAKCNRWLDGLSPSQLAEVVNGTHACYEDGRLTPELEQVLEAQLEARGLVVSFADDSVDPYPFLGDGLGEAEEFDEEEGLGFGEVVAVDDGPPTDDEREAMDWYASGSDNDEEGVA